MERNQYKERFMELQVNVLEQLPVNLVTPGGSTVDWDDSGKQVHWYSYRQEKQTGDMEIVSFII